MKPIQLAVVAGIGILGGALVMRWHDRPQPVTPASAPAQISTTPAAQPAAPPPPVNEPQPPSNKVEPSPTRHKSVVRHRAAKQEKQPERKAESEIASNQNPQPPQAATPPAPPAPTESHPETVEKPEQAVFPPPPPPPPPAVTLAAGTLLPVRLGESLSSESNHVGDMFSATLEEPLVVSGYVIAERGARLEGKVVRVERAGRVKGVADLAIELVQLNTSDHQHVPIRTEIFEVKGPTSHGKDAAKIGAGAAIGAAIGAIAGGGKGAGIGAAAGGAAGTGEVLATRGEPAVIKTETRINFRLADSITITEKR